MTPASPPDVDAIRARFPAIESGTVFFDNAGGAQVPAVVADAVRDFMLTSYVQTGAGYDASRRAAAGYRRAHDFAGVLMNAGDAGQVALGASSSIVSRMLADCYDEVLPAEAEIVVAESGHESNIGPWMRLARTRTVRLWPVDRERLTFHAEGLAPLLNERTALVVFPHVSNIFGEIVDVPGLTRQCHDAGARVVLDSVAFAPHRPVDVTAWGVDWCVLSAYKVYAPHISLLYGRSEAFAELHGPNHYFIDRSDVPKKFELGNASYEACAGLTALYDHLAFLAAADSSTTFDRDVVTRAFDHMTAIELPLQARLIDGLSRLPGVRIIGPARSDAGRVATVSFVHERLASAGLADAANRRRIGVRHGNFYSQRLCERLDIRPDDGVVRASLVHYNTAEEVDLLLACLDETIAAG